MTRKVKKLFTLFLIQEKIVNLKLNLGNIFMRKKKFNIHMLFSLSALQSLLETIDAYVRRLWTLAKSYEYKRFENKLITDHIVISCLSFCLQRLSLLQEKDLSLKLRHAIAWKLELSDKQVTRLEKGNTLTHLRITLLC